ncbi:MAG TPA: STAS domain-containing protein [Solirubrobacter sp.]|nr:STAS domain-containing protein [Solirubrobacter sp.]
MSGEDAFRPPRFDVTVAEGPERTTIALSGELDLVSAPQLTEALAGAAGRPITIDLRELAFMDSTGLRALLGAARDHGELKLAGPLQPPVQRLLELTQTLTILPFED